MNDALNRFYLALREVFNWTCIYDTLDWDQKVMMPVEAADHRVEQLELLSSVIHGKTTDPKFLETVDGLYSNKGALNEKDLVNVRECKRQLDRARKLPVKFVAERTKAAATSFQVWTEARAKNDWQAVEPHLTKVVQLARKEADYLGYEQNPYDALLDGYEPGARLSVVKPLLSSLGQGLTELIPSISAKFKNTPSIEGDFPEETQHKLGSYLAKQFGYNFQRGRLDTTHHPFATTLGVRDVRITTHFYRNDFLSSVFSILHETGHALYELGLPEEHRGTPLGSAISLGIHESQSRLWENIIGRSRQYSHFLHRTLKDYFPEVPKRFTPETLWAGINIVTPSFIRIEADEVTYSLHVIVRMLLEEQLISGELAVADLPNAWNDLYKKYLGITPPDYNFGVMQDSHWYGGSIGYFPTYALGNLYGAMMIKVAERDIPTLWQQVEEGVFLPLLNWLNENVFRHGMTYTGPELIKKITGQELNERPFLEYVKAKFKSV